MRSPRCCLEELDLLGHYQEPELRGEALDKVLVRKHGCPNYFRDFEAAARSTNVEPIAARAGSDAEIETIVTSLGKDLGSGLIVMPDFFM